MQFNTLFKIIVLLKVESILGGYRAQFNADCGQPKTSGRIVGGTDADIGEFPWMTRIGIQQHKYARPSFFCGGSLITDRHILSAAHCFYTLMNQVHQLVVSLGDHDEKGRQVCVGRQCSDFPVVYQVESVMPHNLDETSFKDDVAVLKLIKKVEFTKFIAPVCLPDNISPTTLIGETVVTIGFGLVDSRRRRIAKTLQKITINIEPLKSCNIYYEEPGPGQICAGHPIRDSCDGDSGGPLTKLLSTNDGPKYIQLGIVSFGTQECENSHPAVYTDVNYYLDWIDQRLDSST